MILKRRGFLKSLGLASAGLGLNINFLQAKPVRHGSGTSVAEVALTGRVASGGKGIPDVTVTDGRNVTRTDAKGKTPFQQATL